MTEKEYLEKRVKVLHHYQVQKIGDNGFAYWNLLKESIEEIIKEYNMDVDDVKIGTSYDDEYGEHIISVYYREYETIEETEKRLERQKYYKDSAVKSMKELINRNKEEAVQYIKELGLV